MRHNIYVARGWRGVWREAVEAAHADGISTSDLALLALRDYLAARKRRIARGQPAVIR